MKARILIIFLVLLSQLAQAHVEVYSQYFFTNQNKVSQIWVTLKTSDVLTRIVDEHPELQGADMNGEAFKSAALNYLESCVWLAANGKEYHVTGQAISFGGQTATAVLNINAEPGSLGKVKVHITCFTEGLLHVSNEVLIGSGKDQKVFTLTELDRSVDIDLGKLSFDDGQGVNLRQMKLKWMAFCGIIFGVIGLGYMVYKHRKGKA